MGSLSVPHLPHIQHTSITQSGLKMLPTKSLLPIILVLLPCCLSVPRFLNSKDQVRKCFSGFIRCRSSTKTIPQRCFEINQCVLTFSTLERYNEICSNIYDDNNEKSMKKIDSNSQMKMMMMEDVVENMMEDVMEDVMVEKIQEMEDDMVDTRSSYFPKK